MQRKFNLFILGFFSLLPGLVAQESLSFEEALKRMLEYNFDLRIQLISTQQAENTASLLNNNYLPTLNVNGGAGWTYYGGNNRLETQTIELDPNASYSYDAGLSINYVLFNGFGRKYSLLINKENLKIAEAQLELQIQNSILELSRLYYELAFLEENVSLLTSSRDISYDRYIRAQYGFEYGRNARLDMLTAKVDYNQDSIAVLNAQLDYENAQRNFNLLLGEEDVSKSYKVDREVAINNSLALGQIMDAVYEGNIDLRINESNYLSSKYALSNARSPWMPTLSANAGYDYRGSEDPNGAFLKGSQRFGPQAGLSLSWNLFNGQNVVNQRNAKLSLEQAELRQEQIKQQVKAQAYNAFSLYKTSLAVLDAQEDNVSTAKLNFDRSKEALALGQITTAEYRAAQLNYLQSLQNRSRAKYDAKNAELQVLALMGELK